MNKLKLQEKSKVEIKNRKTLNLAEAGKVLETIFNSIPKSILNYHDDAIKKKITHQFRGKLKKITEVWDYDYESNNHMMKLETPHAKITSPFLKIEFSYRSEFPESVTNRSKYYEEKKVYIEIVCVGRYCNWETEHKIDADLKFEMDGCQAQSWSVKFHDGITKRTQMAWGNASEKSHHTREIRVTNSQHLSALVDEVLPNMMKTMKKFKEQIDDNDISRAEKILDKHYKSTKYEVTYDQALGIVQYAEDGLKLGAYISQKCRAELYEVIAKYTGIADGIEDIIEKMNFEALMDVAKKYMKEYCKEIKD